MKHLLFGILTVLSQIATGLLSVWVIVEFIIYLVKDDKFNWNSVWLTCVSIVLCFVFMILYLVTTPKKTIRKSTFQQRIEKYKSDRNL